PGPGVRPGGMRPAGESRPVGACGPSGRALAEVGIRLPVPQPGDGIVRPGDRNLCGSDCALTGVPKCSYTRIAAFSPRGLEGEPQVSCLRETSAVASTTQEKTLPKE